MNKEKRVDWCLLSHSEEKNVYLCWKNNKVAIGVLPRILEKKTFIDVERKWKERLIKKGELTGVHFRIPKKKPRDGAQRMKNLRSKRRIQDMWNVRTSDIVPVIM